MILVISKIKQDLENGDLLNSLIPNTRNCIRLRIENLVTLRIQLGYFLYFQYFQYWVPVISGPDPNSNPKSAPKTIPFFGLCPKPIPR